MALAWLLSLTILGDVWLIPVETTGADKLISEVSKPNQTYRSVAVLYSANPNPVVFGNKKDDRKEHSSNIRHQEQRAGSERVLFESGTPTQYSSMP